MNNLNPLLFFLAVAAFLLAACGGSVDSAGDGSLSGANLDDTFWTLTSMAGTRLLAGSEITAGFIDGELSGSTGCNTYFSAYKTAGERITIEGLAFTEMACMTPEGVMDQEQRFLALLGQVDSFQLTADELLLLTADGEQLIFSPRP